MKTNSNELQGKDLINVGIFTSIYFAIVFVVSMLGYIPILMPLLCVVVPIVGGVPFMLFLTKVKKFGMVLIMSLIMGILMLLTGMGYWTIIIGSISGFIAELVLKSGKYKSSGKSILTAGIFSIWAWGNFIPMFINRSTYFSNLATGGYGQKYADTLASYMPYWMLPTLLIVSFISGIIGGLLGKNLLKKHFKKAGIA